MSANPVGKIDRVMIPTPTRCSHVRVARLGWAARSAVATTISRERNLPRGRRAKSGSAAFRVRIRRVAASTRSPPDIIFEYSARFQRQFETRDKCSDRAREFERLDKVLPRIFETPAENNSRER